MKIMVTGALGYIGTELVYKLAQHKGNEIIAIDNSTEAIKHRLGFLLRYPNVRFINADVGNIKDINLLPKVDIIVHLAAIVGYISCNNNANETQRVNILGTENIASLQTPTIFLSTGSVYGKIQNGTCNEETKLNPQTLYAETKAQGEEILKQTSNVILRPATAYGLSFKVRDDLLVHTLIKDAVIKKHIKLYQPHAKRSFYSVQKLVELIEYVCFNYNKFENNILNVGCGSGNLIKEQIVEIISKYIDFNLDIVHGEDLDNRDYNVDYSLLEKLWPDYNENFLLQIEKITEYYKSCQ